MHVNICETVQLLAGFLQCSDRKFEEAEVFKYVSFVYCVFESKKISSTVGATKSGRKLPLYEIGVLLKMAGTGSYYTCLLHHLNTCVF